MLGRIRFANLLNYKTKFRSFHVVSAEKAMKAKNFRTSMKETQPTDFPCAFSKTVSVDAMGAEILTHFIEIFVDVTISAELEICEKLFAQSALRSAGKEEKQ